MAVRAEAGLSAKEEDYRGPQTAEEFHSWLISRAWMWGTEGAIEKSAAELEFEVHLLHAFGTLEETIDDFKTRTEPVQHGKDHFHWVLFQDGPERRSSLLTLSEIGANSDQNITGHVHLDDETGHEWLEIVLPLEPGLTIRDETTKEATHLDPLKAHVIKAGIVHATYNEANHPVRYFILRRRLIHMAQDIFGRGNNGTNNQIHE